jgi:serine/threonine-protein kinase
MSGRYNIIGTLASGGMGTVYLARMSGSAGFSRLVAVKKLHPEFAADPQLIAMLIDEGRVASKIRHANVIHTLDLVTADDDGFALVLEYVEGVSLDALLRRSEVPRPIAIALIRGMLRGLQAAHEAGVVHRDVSPHNVLVGVDGIPRVIDFGIAKAKNRIAAATRSGEVRGKFAYMAPEQLREEPITPQADVYAAGVVLFQLLTGKLPFATDDNRVLMAKVLTDAVPAPGISESLDAAVLTATAPSLSERYSTASELHDALANEISASEDEVGAWVRAVAPEQLARQKGLAAATTDTPPAQPRRTWLVLPIGGVVGVLAVAIGASFQGSGSEPEAAAAPSAVVSEPPAIATPPTTAERAVDTASAEPRPVPRRPFRRPAASATALPKPIVPDHDTDHR